MLRHPTRSTRPPAGDHGQTPSHAGALRRASMSGTTERPTTAARSPFGGRARRRGARRSAAVAPRALAVAARSGGGGGEVGTNEARVPRGGRGDAVLIQRDRRATVRCRSTDESSRTNFRPRRDGEIPAQAQVGLGLATSTRERAPTGAQVGPGRLAQCPNRV